MIATESIVPKQPPAAPRKKALVVENRRALAALLEGILTRCGVDTEVVGNGAEALVRLRDHAEYYDLVCSDVELPGASGWTVLEWVRSRCPGLGLVLVSGEGADFPAEAARRGALAAFGKPFRVAEVQQTLAANLAYL